MIDRDTRLVAAYVYAIRITNTLYVKIGYSIYLRKRVKQLQTGCPASLVIEFDLVDILTAKYAFHKSLTAQGKHLRGEWFQLEMDLGYFTVIAKSL